MDGIGAILIGVDVGSVRSEMTTSLENELVVDMGSDAQRNEDAHSPAPFRQLADLLRQMHCTLQFLGHEGAEQLGIGLVAIATIDRIRQAEPTHRSAERTGRVGILGPPNRQYLLRIRHLPALVLPSGERAYHLVDQFTGEDGHHVRLMPALGQEGDGSAAGQGDIIVMRLNEKRGSGRQTVHGSPLFLPDAKRTGPSP